MDCTIQEVRPGELVDAVEPDEVTLVLGAPGIGTSQRLRSVGRTVRELPETVAVDDELVIVEDFVSAVFDLDDESVATYTYEFGEKSLFAGSGGAVLLARPRSFDWLCQRDLGVDGQFVETVDTVLVVRTPPTAAPAAINEVRQRLSKRGVGDLREDELSVVLDRARYPPYYFETPQLQAHLGWYDATVTPEAFVPLSKQDAASVILPGDVRRAFGGYDVSIDPFSEEFADAVSPLVPSGGLPSRIPNERAPPVLAAVALVAVGLDEQADWLELLARLRIVSTAAEALEIALDLPPETVDHLTVFAADPARALIGDRLADDGDRESVLDVAREAVGEPVDVLQSASSTFGSISTDPEEYGLFRLVGSWYWDGPQALHDAAAERELPAQFQETNGEDENGRDWRSFADDTDLLDALDGGLVVLSGPKASGKRHVAASLATELAEWGATIRLPALNNPDHIREGVEATPNAVVVATYGAGPARIPGDDGLRALPEWVDEGSCVGALLICDDAYRDRLDDICDRAGCEELTAWTDRVEISMDDMYGSPDREPAAVAEDLLDAIGWNEVQSPSRRTVDVESVTDQSTLAAIVGVPDHSLDGEYVGATVAEAVDVISMTHGPTAAGPWLSVIDDLVAEVGLNRTDDPDEALLYRGEVYGTAITAVARAKSTTDEWVHAVARGVLEVTNETAAPHGREAVGGDLEPFATAFTGALARLAQPPDGSIVNHGAIGCVVAALHEMVDDGWQFPLHFVYGGAVRRIVRRADDPAAANGGISTIVSRVRQYGMSPNDRYTMGILGNSFASMLGAVADVECSAEELSAWVADIASRAREAAQDITDRESQCVMLKDVYVAGLGMWVFEHGCPDETFAPFLDAVGQSVCQTATATELIENPETFVLDAYGQAVWLVVRSGDLDHAEQLFAGCHRIVDSIASAEPFENERTVRAGLHAAALAAFGEVENDDPDQVNQYPYGSETIPFESSLGFEDWMERYDASVMRGIAADGPAGETTQYLTDVYRGGLSTHVRGYDPESADSNGGVTPRGEHTWYTGLTDRIEARATTSDSVDDPITFLADVFGGAAGNWAADGESGRTQEWIEVLIHSLRTSRESIDGPDKTDWFDAFAATDAEILAAVLTRTDGSERTHERLVESVLSQIKTAANAPDNPPHPVVYVASVFGRALALAADARPEEVRFGVTQVLAVFDEEFSLDWVDIERAGIFERIYAEALAIVGRTQTDISELDEWLEIVSARIEATATKELPERPAEFVAAVYVRALLEAAHDGADEWRRRLDAELHEFTRGPHVNDPAAFLEGVYADLIVEAVKSQGPWTEIEVYIDAVNDSIQAAIDADLLRADIAHERTFSQAGDTLSTANVRARADYVARLDQGLQATGNGDIASTVFVVEGIDEPDGSDIEPDSTTDGGPGHNQQEREDQ